MAIFQIAVGARSTVSTRVVSVSPVVRAVPTAIAVTFGVCAAVSAACGLTPIVSQVFVWGVGIVAVCPVPPWSTVATSVGGIQVGLGSFIAWNSFYQLSRWGLNGIMLMIAVWASVLPSRRTEVFVVWHVGVSASQGRCSKSHSSESARVMWFSMVVFWVVVFPIIRMARSVGTATAALIVPRGVFAVRVVRHGNQGLIVESIFRSVRIPMVILAMRWASRPFTPDLVKAPRCRGWAILTVFPRCPLRVFFRSSDTERPIEWVSRSAAARLDRVVPVELLTGVGVWIGIKVIDVVAFPQPVVHWIACCMRRRMDTVLMRTVIIPVSSIIPWVDMACVARIVCAVDSAMRGMPRRSRGHMMAGVYVQGARGTAVNWVVHGRQMLTGCGRYW
jgi:hypothetical protein